MVSNAPPMGVLTREGYSGYIAKQKEQQELTKSTGKSTQVREAEAASQAKAQQELDAYTRAGITKPVILGKGETEQQATQRSAAETSALAYQTSNASGRVASVTGFLPSGQQTIVATGITTGQGTVSGSQMVSGVVPQGVGREVVKTRQFHTEIYQGNAYTTQRDLTTINYIATPISGRGMSPEQIARVQGFQEFTSSQGIKTAGEFFNRYSVNITGTKEAGFLVSFDPKHQITDYDAINKNIMNLYPEALTKGEAQQYAVETYLATGMMRKAVPLQDVYKVYRSDAEGYAITLTGMPRVLQPGEAFEKRFVPSVDAFSKAPQNYEVPEPIKQFGAGVTTSAKFIGGTGVELGKLALSPILGFAKLKVYEQGIIPSILTDVSTQTAQQIATGKYNFRESPGIQIGRHLATGEYDFTRQINRAGLLANDKDVQTFTEIGAIGLLAMSGPIGALAAGGIWSYMIGYQTAKTGEEAFTGKLTEKTLAEEIFLLLPLAKKSPIKFGKVDIKTPLELGQLSDLKLELGLEATKRGGYIGGQTAVEAQLPKGSVRSGVDVDIYFKFQEAMNSFIPKAEKIVQKYGIETTQEAGTGSHIKIKDVFTGKDVADIGIRNQQGDKIVNVEGIDYRKFTQVLSDKMQILKHVSPTEPKYVKSVGDVFQIKQAEELPVLGTTNVYRGIYLSLGEKATPLIGIANQKIVFGIPSTENLAVLKTAMFPELASKNIASYPQSAIETNILTSRQAQKPLGISAEDFLKQELTQFFLQRLKNTKSIYTNPLPRETKVLTGETGNKALDVLYNELTISPYEGLQVGTLGFKRIYGSVPMAAKINPAYARKPGDIEVEFTSKETAVGFGETLVPKWESVGVKDVKLVVSGIKGQKSTGIMVGMEKALELKFPGEAELIGSTGFRYGMKEVRPNIKIEGIPSQSPGEQTIRKASTSATWWTDVSKPRGETANVIIDAPTHRPKDVVDAYALFLSQTESKYGVKNFLNQVPYERDIAKAEVWRNLNWRNPEVQTKFAEFDANREAYMRNLQSEMSREPISKPQTEPMITKGNVLSILGTSKGLSSVFGSVKSSVFTGYNVQVSKSSSNIYKSTYSVTPSRYSSSFSYSISSKYVSPSGQSPSPSPSPPDYSPSPSPSRSPKYSPPDYSPSPSIYSPSPSSYNYSPKSPSPYGYSSYYYPYSPTKSFYPSKISPSTSKHKKRKKSKDTFKGFGDMGKSTFFILPDLRSVGITEALTGQEAVSPRATKGVRGLFKMALTGYSTGYVPTEQMRTGKISGKMNYKKLFG